MACCLGPGKSALTSARHSSAITLALSSPGAASGIAVNALNLPRTSSSTAASEVRSCAHFARGVGSGSADHFLPIAILRIWEGLQALRCLKLALGPASCPEARRRPYFLGSAGHPLPPLPLPAVLALLS